MALAMSSRMEVRMKKVMLLAIVVLGGAVLLPSLGQTREYRRGYRLAHPMTVTLTGEGIDDSDTPDRADVLIGTAPEEADACGGCPKGQVCKMKMDGGYACGVEIKIDCPDPSDLLCGA